MENTDGAFGYLSQRLHMRDCGLFGRPRSHNPLLAIWLDGFDPIGAVEWNYTVGLHKVRYSNNPLRGATPTKDWTEVVMRRPR